MIWLDSCGTICGRLHCIALTHPFHYMFVKEPSDSEVTHGNSNTVLVDGDQMVASADTEIQNVSIYLLPVDIIRDICRGSTDVIIIK